MKAGGKQRTDSTHVLVRVRSLSNLECVGETLRAVLNDLAQLDADWLAQDALPTCPDGGGDQSGAHRCLAAGKVARVNLPASSRFPGHSSAVPTLILAPPGGVLIVSSFDVIHQQSLCKGGGSEDEGMGPFSFRLA